MKFKTLAIFLIVLFFSVGSFADGRKFELEISMENTSISKSESEIPVKVKITNEARQELKTAGLNNVNLYFSKCLSRKVCSTRDDIYIARVKIPNKTLKERESFEFEVNLADLYWEDIISSQRNSKSPKNFNRVPVENIYLSAAIQIPAGFKYIEGIDQKIPLVESFSSNTITVVLSK